MSTITPHYRSVQSLLANRAFAIDDYQREYKWEHTHIGELLDDLTGSFFGSYSEGDETGAVAEYAPYFLGSIIVSEHIGKQSLIDGQQRVTSLTLLLIHLYRVAKERRLAVETTLAPLIFSDHLGTPRFNLDVPERRAVLEALFHGADFNTDGQAESVRAIHARYGDIEDRELADELGTAFPHFVYWLLSRVGLIEIVSGSDDYATRIFETMNDRGKPLSPVDMLKAFLLSPIADADARQRANETWKRETFGLISWGGEHEPERDAVFFKALLRARYATSIRERKAKARDLDWELIGGAFHRWVRDNASRLGLGTAAENAAFIERDVPFYARAYRRILDASRTYTTPGLKSVFYNAHNEFTWQNTVLLAPLVPTDDDETVRAKLEATAAYLDIWIVRRVVNYVRVGYSATAYAMYLLCQDIRGLSLDDLRRVLAQKLESLNDDDAALTGSPRRGRSGIDDLRLNQFSKRYIFHILARLTAHTETLAGETDPFAALVDRKRKNAYDIEHIVPNTFGLFEDAFTSKEAFQDWRNHIAGLLLLPADVNRSLQAKPFEEKRPIYAKQYTYAASLSPAAYEHAPQFLKNSAAHDLPFAPLDHFGAEEQQTRLALVHALAARIWSPTRLGAPTEAPIVAD